MTTEPITIPLAPGRCIYLATWPDASSATGWACELAYPQGHKAQAVEVLALGLRTLADGQALDLGDLPEAEDPLGRLTALPDPDDPLAAGPGNEASQAEYGAARGAGDA